MKANMGTVDRLVRSVIALAVIVLYFTNQITGIAAVILLAVSGIFLLTSFMSYCPIYGIFRVSSRKKKSLQ